MRTPGFKDASPVMLLVQTRKKTFYEQPSRAACSANTLQKHIIYGTTSACSDHPFPPSQEPQVPLSCGNSQSRCSLGITVEGDVAGGM